MTRAALLPAGSDPFLIAYWLRHYRTWADQVDELHVAICGPIPPEVVSYIQACIDAAPHARVTFIPDRTAHGQVLTLLLAQTSADHILFVEDDAFVRRPETIASAFAAIENGDTDLVGCPRDGYASESLISAARRRFGDGLRGLAFWPTFLFVARAALQATDRVFDGTLWSAGDRFLGSVLTESATADTLIWASFQLREQGLRITLREPFRIGDPVPIDAPWFHVGSLSSGHGYSWQNAKPKSPEDYAEDIAQWQRLPAGETAKRVAWWQRVWENWDGGIPDYHDAYGNGMRQFMADFGVDQGEVDGLRTSFDYLPTWAES